MPIGVGANNPGDLTVFGPGSILYPGQTGTIAGNGFNYATFPDQASGIAALENYITRHVANGWNTVSKFVYGFLGTSSANAANPHPQAYLSAFEKATGLGANSPLSSSQAALVAKGIAAGEGTLSAFPGLSSSGGDYPGGLVSTPGYSFPDLSGSISAPSLGIPDISGSIDAALQNSPFQIPGLTPNPDAPGGSNPQNWLQSALDGVGKSLEPILFRSGFGLLGVVVLTIGLLALVFSNKTVQEAAKTAVVAAA